MVVLNLQLIMYLPIRQLLPKEIGGFTCKTCQSGCPKSFIRLQTLNNIKIFSMHNQSITDLCWQFRPLCQRPFFKTDSVLYYCCWSFGAAMGSPVSPIVANLFMEALEQKAISTVPAEEKVRGRCIRSQYICTVIALSCKHAKHTLVHC